MRFHNKNIPYRTKNARFPTPSPQITSGEISAKEAAEERIWAGRTPPADAPGPGRSEEYTILRENYMRVKRSKMYRIMLKQKITKEIENNAKTWYNLDMNKPVLVRQRYAVVL